MADKRKPLILTLDPLELTEAEVAEPEPARLAAAPPTPAAAAPPLPAGTAAPPARPPRRAKPARRAKVRAEPAPAAAGPVHPGEAGPLLARAAYPVATVAAVLWAGCLFTFVLGYERGGVGFEYAPFRWGVAAGLALLPAALLVMFAYLLRQSTRLAEEARRARGFADGLSLPATSAALAAATAVGRVREEIARAQASADEAARRMGALHATLAEETRLVSEAAAQAERAASRLGGRLQSERAELNSLAGALDGQLASAAEGAARHARLAAEASDLAGANLQEAQAALAARTADLVAAAADTARAAQGAGAELATETERLGRLGHGLKAEQAAWAATAGRLLADEEDAAVRLETQRARFVETAGQAQAGAAALSAAADEGAEALRRLIADAVRQVNAVAEAARAQASDGSAYVAAQRAAVETELRASLERMAEAADAARASASAAARALAAEAESVAEAARRRIEGLGEAAFHAGQRADQVFDARLAAAKRAIEAQASLVEDAGARSAQRIEAGVEAVRAALGEAEGLAEEVERRFARLPEAASTPSAGALRAADPAPDPVPLPAPAAPALRPRLRLAAGDDDLFAAAPPSAPPDAAPLHEPPSSPAGEPEGGWSWKDLLTAMDDGGPALDDDALAERMIGEIEAMGVDPGALLPRARIDEIARAVDAGDRTRAREAVRRLAPAAVRRLSRRVLTDKVLRGQAELYRRRYGDLVRDQARRDEGNTSTLLGSDPGRAFLLLDAAVGDLH